MASELHLGESNWKFFQVGYPVDTPTGGEKKKKKKINDVNISLFVETEQNEPLPFRVLSDPRQWLHVMLQLLC